LESKVHVITDVLFAPMIYGLIVIIRPKEFIWNPRFCIALIFIQIPVDV